MKRNGTRSFKNPPQPHMCIQDVIKGDTAPCYINVLSWDQIAKPCKPSQPLPLYGGMRVRPPRTRADAIVFAVMANPEILQISGKNAQDPKKRSILIEMLLDFVEAMNTGVVFTRRYKILQDRDITGELKEVWNAVQARRDREQPPPQQETWIDVQPPVPQYPQYPDQQQQSQQQQQQQEYAPQPPQYHSSVAYGRAITGEGMHYEGYGHQPGGPVMPQNEHMYQPSQMVPQQFHGNLPRIPQDQYNYRERRIDMRLEDLASKLPQQSCPAYPTPRYQFSQLPRQVVIPQYVNSNMHPNTGLNYAPQANTNVNPVINANLASSAFQPYITYQQRMDNAMHVDMRRMQPQQQQQMHMNAVPVPQYEPTAPFNVQTSSMNVLRLGRPHMGVAQKNNASKRPVNSSTHSKQSSCANCHSKDNSDNGAKPKSPVKVLQRELPSASTVERQEANNHVPADNNKASVEKLAGEETKDEAADANEGTKKTNDTENNTGESSKKQNDARPSESGANVGREAAKSSEDTSPTEEKHQETAKTLDVSNGQTASTTETKTQKSKIIVMKGHKHNKETTDNNRTNRGRYSSDQKMDSPKRSQTTVNSIIKSVFKIHPGMSGEESSGKRKTNGQAKGNVKTNGEAEEAQPGYTILKKTETTTQEEVANELAQISIQDCKDTAAEVSPVLL